MQKFGIHLWGLKLIFKKLINLNSKSFKMKQFLHSPDAGTSGSETTVSTPSDTQVRHVANLPRKDADLLAVSKSVNTKWAANNSMALAWKTQPGFASDAAAFETQLANRNTAGGKRSQHTQDLENLDTTIEDALPYVKSYIAEKFGPPNAKAHYAEFGMVHRGASYELPIDRQLRKDALRMMVDAVTANGFDTKQYGIQWWTDIKTKYDAALAAASTGNGNLSGSVSELVALRTTLRRVLHSILLLLEANYPDTFEQVRRDWGFQKEAY